MTFEETMREWRRMCDTEAAKDKVSCGKCPFRHHVDMCGSIFDLDPTKFEEIAGLIKYWSDTHPKVQYPTWEEWFKTVGIFAKHAFDTPIPAEIAEKLGVDPL